MRGEQHRLRGLGLSGGADQPIVWPVMICLSTAVCRAGAGPIRFRSRSFSVLRALWTRWANLRRCQSRARRGDRRRQPWGAPRSAGFPQAILAAPPPRSGPLWTNWLKYQFSAPSKSTVAHSNGAIQWVGYRYLSLAQSYLLLSCSGLDCDRIGWFIEPLLQ
jgi:hypothetical protein